MIYLLFLLLILVIAFYPDVILRFAGAVSILQGVFFLLFFVLKKISEAGTAELFDESEYSFMGELLQELTAGIFARFIVVGAVSLLAGIIMLIVSVNLKRGRGVRDKGKHRTVAGLPRSLAAIALLLSISVLARGYVSDIKRQITRIENYSDTGPEELDIGKALDEALDVRLFSSLSQK